MEMNVQSLFSDTLSTQSEWFDIWLRCFGGADAGIWESDTCKGLQVPYVVHTRTIFGMKIRTVCAATNSHTPRFDVLGQPTNGASPCLDALMIELGADLCEFPFVSSSSRIATQLKTSPPRTLYHKDPCETAPYTLTEGDWDTYWESLGKSRRELGRRERKLLGNENTRFVCLSDWDKVSPIFRDILAIEASGWKGKQGSAIIQDENTLQFYTQLAESWAKQGALRLFLLYEEDTPIAFELDALYNGILHCFKHGYLDSYSKKGPGQVLRLQVLRWAFSNPDVRVFDMFGPKTESKSRWATNSEDLYTIRVFRNSPKGIIAWSRYVLLPRLKTMLLKR